MHVYNEDFFAGHSDACQRSARRVVPMLMVSFSPRSVLDVGCGDGTWLAEFSRAGIKEFVGVDGPYIEKGHLRIPADRFVAHDLTQPLQLGRKFDLATSFEVAEHLPPESAETFVDSLTTHSDLVIFSASIPGQFGEHHVNEQWPSYWVDRFRHRGFHCFDILRAAVWTDPQISWWYRQNMLVFATEKRAAHIPVLADYDPAKNLFPLELAHPDFMAHFRNTLSEDNSVRLLAKKLAKLVARRTKHFVLRGRK
jgi:SAM-dependent methyltransferase